MPPDLVKANQDHKFFLKIAQLTASRSKCISHKVGCVIVKNGDIIVSGYNGTPPGYMNCCEVFKDGHNEKHHDWSNHHEVHAEQNAIARAAKNGIALNDSILYCTLKPCMHCTKLLIMAGITRIFFIDTYDRNNDIVLNTYMIANGVQYTQLSITI